MFIKGKAVVEVLVEVPDDRVPEGFNPEDDEAVDELFVEYMDEGDIVSEFHCNAEYSVDEMPEFEGIIGQTLIGQTSLDEKEFYREVIAPQFGLCL